jgi:hypothetical protein
MYILDEQNCSHPDCWMGQESWPDGWLVAVNALHNQRAPGRTFLAALEDARFGSIDEPLHNSKGCGAQP